MQVVSESDMLAMSANANAPMGAPKMFDMSSIGAVDTSEAERAYSESVLNSFSFLTDALSDTPSTPKPMPMPMETGRRWQALSETNYQNPQPIYDPLAEYSQSMQMMNEEYSVQTIGERQNQRHNIVSNGKVLASLMLMEAASKICKCLNEGKNFSDTTVVNSMVKDLKFQRKLQEMNSLDRNSEQFKKCLNEAAEIKKSI